MKTGPEGDRMAGSFCRYFSSLWFDNDGSVNNLTIDEQNGHELHALRQAVFDLTNDFKVINMTEQGFDKCRTIYLDSILRMTRAAKDPTNPDKVIWDNTSKMMGVAPGRQLAADALFRMYHKGLATETGKALFSTAFDILGSLLGDSIPGIRAIDEEKSMVSPSFSQVSGEKIFYVQSKFPDGKISSKKFEGMNDLTTFACNKDWE